MTAQAHVPHLSTGADYQSLAARFRPIFARIADGSVERERTRSLPFEPLKPGPHGLGGIRLRRQQQPHLIHQRRRG